MAEILKQEFRNQFIQLRKTILDGLSYFIVWQYLNEEYDQSIKYINRPNDFWGQYFGFLAPSRKALLSSALLQLSKAYDVNPKSISVRRIFSLALRNRKELTPYATRNSLKNILEKIEEQSKSYRLYFSPNQVKRMSLLNPKHRPKGASCTKREPQ